MEISPGRTVLIFDENPSVLVGLLKCSQQDIGIDHIYSSSTHQQALRIINSIKPNILIADVTRRIRGKRSSGISDTDLFTRAMLSRLDGSFDEYNPESESPHQSIQNSDGTYRGVELIASLTKKEYTGHVPQKIILTDILRNDGYVSLGAGYSAIELGCIDFLPNPTTRDLIKAIQRIDNQSPPVAPRPIIFCGTKFSGKTELGNYFWRYDNYFDLAPKIATRKPRYDDRFRHDTLLFQRIPKNHNQGIYWKSYGDECYISLESIRRILDRGMNCGVVIGQLEGVEEMLNQFPNAEVYFIRMTPKTLERIRRYRPDDKVSFDNIIRTQQMFDAQRYTPHLNWRFYDVVDRIWEQMHKVNLPSERHIQLGT